MKINLGKLEISDKFLLTVFSLRKYLVKDEACEAVQNTPAFILHPISHCRIQIRCVIGELTKLLTGFHCTSKAYFHVQCFTVEYNIM
jgi:hypothetical protein